MSKQLRTFFSSKAFAVVGASENRDKYGNIAYRVLRNKRFPVYPVNPYHRTIEGDECFPNVTALPDDVKSVVLVVPPHVTEKVVEECNERCITGIWMQPGAESYQAIEYATTRSMTVIHDACIMVVVGPVHDHKNLHEWLEKATRSNT